MITHNELYIHKQLIVEPSFYKICYELLLIRNSKCMHVHTDIDRQTDRQTHTLPLQPLQ